MAAGLLRVAAGESIAVYSAGSEPAERLNPAVVAAMEEIGIDITDRVPTKLTEDLVEAVDVVVTMGCGDACPVYRGKRYLDWEVQDPAGQPLEVVRTIRDVIAARVNRLIDELLDECA
jgi:arsenate reductase (thioredoxin)